MACSREWPCTVDTSVPAARARQGLSSEVIIGFVFESLLDERAVSQIQECSQLLCELVHASAERHRPQWAILKGMTGLLTAPKHGGYLLNQAPDILMALCAYPKARSHPRPAATFSRKAPPHPAAAAGAASASSRRLWSSSGTRTRLTKTAMRARWSVKRPRHSSRGLC